MEVVRLPKRFINHRSEFINQLKTTITHLGFLLIYPEPLALLCNTIKNTLKLWIEVQILPDSEVTWQTGNNTFKSLMIAKAMYEILHAEYCGATFWTTAFSNLCQWSSIFFQNMKSFYVCRQYESLSWAQKYIKGTLMQIWKSPRIFEFV